MLNGFEMFPTKSRTVIIIRQLTGSDLQWFDAARTARKTESKQRALNFNMEIMESVFPKSILDSQLIRLDSECRHPKSEHSTERSITLQGKNWRLGGKKVMGEAFELVEPDDYFLSIFVPDGEKYKMIWSVVMRRESMSTHFQLSSLVPEMRRRMCVLEAHSPLYERVSSFIHRVDFERAKENSPFVQPVRAVLDELINGEVHDYNPDFARLIAGISRIGYDFSDAVCDIVDNSIDAKSSNILVRLISSPGGSPQIFIADDGEGMNETEILSAIRFGSAEKSTSGRLGKFGLGLKFASLSQTGVFTVASRKKNQKWAAFRCERSKLEQGNFTPSKVAFNPEHEFSLFSEDQSGTIIWWEDLRFIVDGHVQEAGIEELRNELWMHLRLIFHRFLQDGSVRIFTDIQSKGVKHTLSSTREAKPLDPFASPHLSKLFPAVASLNFKGHIFQLKAVLWDSRYLSEEQFTLTRGPLESQGFYFYRNGRLITYGNWANVELVNNKYQLLRVSVELPPGSDDMMNLNVSKSEVSLPPYEFIDNLRKLPFSNGKELPAMLEEAAKIWKKRKTVEAQQIVYFTPGSGFDSILQKAADELLKKSHKKLRPLDFVWGDLEDRTVFELDRNDLCIVLNEQYRKILNVGMNSGSADAPIIKMLLFMLLKNHIMKTRLSVSTREHLEQCNELMYLAIKSMERK